MHVSSQPSSPLTFIRAAHSALQTSGAPCGTPAPETSCDTRQRSSHGPPGVGTAHATSNVKSDVCSGKREGREVCVCSEFSRLSPIYPVPDVEVTASVR